MKRLLVIFLLIILFDSCGKNRCEEPVTVNSSSVVISFIDKQTGKYLYSETNPLYKIDSLKVFDETGKQVQLLFALNSIPGSTSRYYNVAVGPVYDQQTDQNS